jgi:hypothetical protein
MRGIRRMKGKRGLTGKLSVGLALVSFTTTIGFPLPATNVKNHSIPFPCQDHACGCQSAEQCWQHCCCFTAAERWAWAKAHHVEPPAYAQRPSNEEHEHAGCAVCSHHHASHPAQNSRAKLSSSVGWVLGISANYCGGRIAAWFSSGAVIPPPPVVTWHPSLLPSGRIFPVSLSPVNLSIAPLDPPPR